MSPLMWAASHRASGRSSRSGATTTRSYFPTSAANWVRDRGAVPIIFWEPYKDVNHCDYARLRQDRRRGLYDTYYVRPWAQAAAAYGGKVLLRFAHEINGAFFPWGIKNKLCDNTIADYKRAWKHLFSVFKGKGATNVKFLWTVSRKGCKKRGCNPYEAYYPGNAYVHYVGFSAFNWGRRSGHRWEALSTVINDVMPYFKKFTKKPVIIAELATNKRRRQQAAMAPRWLQHGLPALAADQGDRLSQRGPVIDRASGLEPRDPVRRLPGLQGHRIEGQVQGPALIRAVRPAALVPARHRRGLAGAREPDLRYGGPTP